MLLFVCVYLVGGTVVDLSPVSGLIVPIRVGVMQSFAALRFMSNQTRFWKASDCPAGVACVTVPADPSVVNVELVTASPQPALALTAHRSTRTRNKYLDVSGQIGASPTSELALAHNLTFGLRGKSLVFDLRGPMEGARGFLIFQGAQSWRMAARLELGPNVIAESVYVHLGLPKMYIPRSAWPFLSAVADWLHLTPGGALYGPCARLWQKVATFTLWTASGIRADVPIQWEDPSHVMALNGVHYCSLQVETGDEPFVFLGRPLLDVYDVCLDAIHKSVWLWPSQAMLVAPSRVLNPPKLDLIHSAVCRSRPKYAICLFKRALMPTTASFVVSGIDAGTIELVRLRADAVVEGLADVAPHWYRTPVVEYRMTGVIAIRATRGKLNFEFASRETAHLVKLGFVEFADPVDRVYRRAQDGRRGECDVCHELIRNKPQLMRLVACNHQFHSDCFGRSLRVSRSCPTCERLIARPLLDES